MAKTFVSQLKDIVEEQQEELNRLKIENRLLRKASQEQRGINGELREENTILAQQLRLLTSH
jgi:regulator of replication initiation timing